jgi:RimJ/RimL family protein N-acetyltransferase
MPVLLEQVVEREGNEVGHGGQHYARAGAVHGWRPDHRKRGDLIDDIGYRRFVPADADLLAEFLTTEEWPYHADGAPSATRIRQQAAAGDYDNDRTRAFWIITGTGAVAGLIRLLDLGDDTPLFDLRIRAAYRGQGLGTRAVRWLTGYLFTEFPGIRRIEGTTRQDNQAMRRTFRTCGYVKEAHYRQAWPAPGGTVRDAVGYAILRTDWQAGTITPPEWDDEPSPSGEQPPPRAAQ